MAEREDCISGPLSTNPELLEQLLTVENVTQEFLTNNGGKVTVLRNMSLCIQDIKFKPQIISLLGPSGAGKTTALRIISGMDKPKSGQVLITNGNKNEMRPVKVGDVGVVFQKYPLFEDLNVLQNLIEPAVRAGNMNNKEAKERALQYLDKFDLVAQGLSWPAQLSGGQRQRVAILQQLMTNKHFIILDEPFSGLDPISITNAINLIISIAHQHTLNTFIIVTHDITSALIISDHVYLMGRERDEAGNPIPGARIMKEYDLISEGLAYRSDIEDLPRFAEIRKEIKTVEFKKL
jgi:NitT/TauT family transport system ATP-binding protein